MISSASLFRYILPALVLVLSIQQGLIAQTSSTCPNNKNSSCTALPFNISNPPDVWLHVPNLSVEEISLVVENVKAQVSISTNVANLVTLNAGVDVSIDKVNLTIVGRFN